MSRSTEKRCCFCGGARGGVYTKRDDPVAGPFDCCDQCDAHFRKRDEIARLERAVLAAAVELHRPHKFVDHDVLEFRLRQASEAYTLALENLGSGLESLAGSA